MTKSSVPVTVLEPETAVGWIDMGAYELAASRYDLTIVRSSS